MKQTNISIFIPHIGCPHRCSFCDQRSISGTAKAPRGEDVSRLLSEQAAHLSDAGIRAEVAFFGGSFTAVERGYMTELLEAAADGVRRYPCYSGIRCSTRPDAISGEILEILKGYGVTAVELGAQSMSDEVLAANERGHTAADVITASRLIKRGGFELGLQMMTGLYKDSRDAVLYTMRQFIELEPDTVRVYPTVILKGTRLAELYESGVYNSFSFEETVSLCAELLRGFESRGIRVIRMGLHASADVERDMIGGTYHPAFREIVESRIFLEDMKKALASKEKGHYIIFTDGRNISRAIGQRRANISALRGLGYDVDIMPLDGEYIKIR